MKSRVVRVTVPLLVLMALSAEGDVVTLKNGQRLEGDLLDKGTEFELKTSYGTVRLLKEEVAKIVPSVAAITEQAEALRAQARALHEEALKIEGDAKAANARLRAAVDLLRKAVALYQEARETYSDEKYASLDLEPVKLIQEMRLYRDKMAAERAPAPEPEKGEPPVAEKPTSPPPASPPSPSPSPEPAPPVRRTFDVPSLLSKAKGGDLDAQCLLGIYHQDYAWAPEEGVKWFRSAAAKDHPRALTRMGLAFLMGSGVRVDYKEAQRWLQKGESKGCALARHYLGVMHHEGKGFPKNWDQADALCEKAGRKIEEEAGKGDPEALCALAWMYRTGMGLYLSADRAVAGYRKAAEAGYAPAQLALGDLYLRGQAGAVDRAEAQKWYLMAAEQGCPEGLADLGEMALPWRFGNWRGVRSSTDVDPVTSEAFSWMTKAAEKKHPSALLWMAAFYYKGILVPKDEKHAFQLLEEALRHADDRNLGNVLNELCVYYTRGVGVKKDPVQAEKYARMGAELGDSQGQYNMGGFAQKAKKYKEAHRWFLLAAKQGHAVAQAYLGFLYWDGAGVKKDLIEARRWLLMAAQQGYPPAIQNLRVLDTEGGGPTDK